MLPLKSPRNEKSSFIKCYKRCSVKYTKKELSIKLTWQRSSHVVAWSFSSSPTAGSLQFETFKRVSILEPVMKKKYINGLYNRKTMELYNTKHVDMPFPRSHNCFAFYYTSGIKLCATVSSHQYLLPEAEGVAEGLSPTLGTAVCQGGGSNFTLQRYRKLVPRINKRKDDIS
jgi:hypothetical protein